jgi:hypothetical protein
MLLFEKQFYCVHFTIKYHVQIQYNIICMHILKVIVIMDTNKIFCVFVVDLYIDTMGYAFTLPLFKFIGGCNVSCYIHYPTITGDMLQRVSGRVIAHNNRPYVARSPFLTAGKLLYYRLFALVIYCNELSLSDTLACCKSFDHTIFFKSKFILQSVIILLYFSILLHDNITSKLIVIIHLAEFYGEGVLQCLGERPSVGPLHR